MPSAKKRMAEPVPTIAREQLGRAGRCAHGFSLVELLVVITIIMVMMAIAGAGVSAARSSQRAQATRALIAKLDAIISQQFASYASLEVPGGTPQNRGPDLRQRISRDMPDRWTDVAAMAGNAAGLTSGHQRAYVAVWNSMPTQPSPTYAGAECLFMIVMRGGVANCLDCTDLAAETIGDEDGDGAFEFHDGWGNPVGYILWPAALELPADSGTKFFTQTAPFSNPTSGRTMRPVIYSPGPDGEYGLERNNEAGNLAAGGNCGNPAAAPTSTSAAPLTGVSDNVTNLDAEAKR
jgi:prepilin-type N-terminal cleavage/methylation domain-containing protein